MLYTRKEAAHQLSISIRSLDYLISSKQLNTRRIGSRILIPHEELVRLATSARIRSVA
jgi:excisionase family DNA binding protein